jgi:hypothetical protein
MKITVESKQEVVAKISVLRKFSAFRQTQYLG